MGVFVIKAPMIDDEDDFKETTAVSQKGRKGVSSVKKSQSNVGKSKSKRKRQKIESGQFESQNNHMLL